MALHQRQSPAPSLKAVSALGLLTVLMILLNSFLFFNNDPAALTGQGDLEIGNKMVASPTGSEASADMQGSMQLARELSLGYTPVSETVLEVDIFKLAVAVVPENQELKLRILANDQSRDMDFRIMSLQGTTLYQNSHAIMAGNSELSLQVDNLSSGVYFFHVWDPLTENGWVKKFQVP
jgi:hypothetical protein